MQCKCGSPNFGICYKFLFEKRELDQLYCIDCGQVYQWTGWQLSLVHGLTRSSSMDRLGGW